MFVVCLFVCLFFFFNVMQKISCSYLITCLFVNFLEIVILGLFDDSKGLFDDSKGLFDNSKGLFA